jgi:fatty acid synthase
MGTQWSGMGKDLMCLETFKDSILRSDRLLQPYGVQLYDLLMNSSDTTFNDTLNSFVGIAAIQVWSMPGYNPMLYLNHSYK